MKKVYYQKTTQHSKPTAVPKFKAPQCGYCSMRSITRCEYPGCELPLCRRCTIRKGGGNLCRGHRDAKLVQLIGTPTPGAVQIAGTMSTRFRPKGPAIPYVLKGDA